MVEVPLTHGKVALIDDEDAERVLARKWRAMESHGNWYAVRTAWVAGRKTTIRMHRLILHASPGNLVDHRNGDGLDNRKENLRTATSSQNNRNRRPNRHGASRYKGVWRKGRQWRASITIDGRLIHLGGFDGEESAARAYDYAAYHLHGEFAMFNFPEEAELIRRVLKRIQAAA